MKAGLLLIFPLLIGQSLTQFQKEKSPEDYEEETNADETNAEESNADDKVSKKGYKSRIFPACRFGNCFGGGLFVNEWLRRKMGMRTNKRSENRILEKNSEEEPGDENISKRYHNTMEEDVNLRKKMNLLKQKYRLRELLRMRSKKMNRVPNEWMAMKYGQQENSGYFNKNTINDLGQGDDQDEVDRLILQLKERNTNRYRSFRIPGTRFQMYKEKEGTKGKNFLWNLINLLNPKKTGLENELQGLKFDLNSVVVPKMKRGYDHDLEY